MRQMFGIEDTEGFLVNLDFCLWTERLQSQRKFSFRQRIEIMVFEKYKRAIFP
jgi:hypothetical protein